MRIDLVSICTCLLFIASLTSAYRTHLEENEEQKYFLKDLIQSGNTSLKLPVEYCRTKQFEMSLKLANCGRILFNTTGCVGSSKSTEVYIPIKKVIRTVTNPCKASKHITAQKKVICSDKSIRSIEIKEVSECQLLTITRIQ